MKRRLFLAAITSVAVTQALPVEAKAREYSAREIAQQLLALANRVEASKITGKSDIAELIEAVSAKVMKLNNVGALCGTDTECANLDRRLK